MPPRKPLDGQYTDGEVNLLNRANIRFNLAKEDGVESKPIRLKDVSLVGIDAAETKKLKQLKIIASSNNTFESEDSVPVTKESNGVFFTQVNVKINVIREKEDDSDDESVDDTIEPTTIKYGVFQVTRVDNQQLDFPHLLTLQQLLQLYKKLVEIDPQYRCDDLLIPLVSKSRVTSNSHIRLMHIKYQSNNEIVATVYESKSKINEALNSTKPTHKVIQDEFDIGPIQPIIEAELGTEIGNEWTIIETPVVVTSATEYLSSFDDDWSQGQPAYNDTDCGVYVLRITDQIIHEGSVEREIFGSGFSEAERSNNEKLYGDYLMAINQEAVLDEHGNDIGQKADFSEPEEEMGQTEEIVNLDDQKDTFLDSFYGNSFYEQALIRDLNAPSSDQSSKELDNASLLALRATLKDIQEKLARSNLIYRDSHQLKRCLHFCSLIEIALGSSMGKGNQYRLDAFEHYRSHPPTRGTPYAQTVAKLDADTLAKFQDDEDVKESLDSIFKRRDELQKPKSK